jgi:hypothetical protein
MIFRFMHVTVTLLDHTVTLLGHTVTVDERSGMVRNEWSKTNGQKRMVKNEHGNVHKTKDQL